MRLPDALRTNRKPISIRSISRPISSSSATPGICRRASSPPITGRLWRRCRQLWLLLFGDKGDILAEWEEAMPEGGAAFSLDSRAVRARFKLGEFTGQLFVHVVGAAGHDVVKYALDTYGDGTKDFSLSAP